VDLLEANLKKTGVEPLTTNGWNKLLLDKVDMDLFWAIGKGLYN
jgi:hypothetical protein